MSCAIREYDSVNPFSSETLVVTAYVSSDGAGVQFSLGENYCALSESAVRDLVLTLQRRLRGVDGYTATGNEREKIKYIYR